MYRRQIIRKRHFKARKPHRVQKHNYNVVHIGAQFRFSFAQLNNNKILVSTTLPVLSYSAGNAIQPLLATMAHSDSIRQLLSY